MITMEQIRAKYPNPVRAEEGARDGYCVGGAFMLFIDVRAGEPCYPGSIALARALCEVNPNLDEKSAYIIACDITARNDEGYFDIAWDLLEKALCKLL